MRVPTLLVGAAQIECELDQHGFGSEGETCTLLREFDGERFAEDASATATLPADASTTGTSAAANPSAALGICIIPRPDAEWLAAIARLQAHSPSHAAVYARVVADNIAGRALYASLGFDQELYRYHYRRASN